MLPNNLVYPSRSECIMEIIVDAWRNRPTNRGRRPEHKHVFVTENMHAKKGTLSLTQPYKIGL